MNVVTAQSIRIRWQRIVTEVSYGRKVPDLKVVWAKDFHELIQEVATGEQHAVEDRLEALPYFLGGELAFRFSKDDETWVKVSCGRELNEVTGIFGNDDSVLFERERSDLVVRTACATQMRDVDR